MCSNFIQNSFNLPQTGNSVTFYMRAACCVHLLSLHLLPLRANAPEETLDCKLSIL